MTKKTHSPSAPKKSLCSVTRGRPSESVKDFSGFMIYKIAQYLQEEFDSFFTEFQIKGRHFVVLHVILRDGPMPQQQLCDGLWIDRATMVGVVQKLIRLGWVKKRAHPDDKRSCLLSATEKGEAFHKQHQDSFARLEKKLFPHLSGDEVMRLKDLLEKTMLGLCDS